MLVLAFPRDENQDCLYLDILLVSVSPPMIVYILVTSHLLG